MSIPTGPTGVRIPVPSRLVSHRPVDSSTTRGPVGTLGRPLSLPISTHPLPPRHCPRRRVDPQFPRRAPRRAPPRPPEGQPPPKRPRSLLDLSPVLRRHFRPNAEGLDGPYVSSLYFTPTGLRGSMGKYTVSCVGIEWTRGPREPCVSPETRNEDGVGIVTTR